MFDFNLLKKNTAGVLDWFTKELTQIRTGQATPVILDDIRIESYGSMMAINQVAGVNIEDARTLRITPWDKENVKPIEKAILTSNLGLSVTVDDKGLRVFFPLMTTESRQSFVKLAKQKLEDAKVSLRQERNKTMGELETKKKNSEISEDQMNRFKIELEKIIKEVGDKLDVHFKKKETEIAG